MCRIDAISFRLDCGEREWRDDTRDVADISMASGWDSRSVQLQKFKFQMNMP